MRGPCHSLRCGFSVVVSLLFSTDIIQPELPNILHNLNFEINQGEKVDLVRMMPVRA
jgi:hypothetical protein